MTLGEGVVGLYRPTWATRTRHGMFQSGIVGDRLLGDGKTSNGMGM